MVKLQNAADLELHLVMEKVESDDMCTYIYLVYLYEVLVYDV